MTTRKPKAITIDYNKGKLYTIRSPHTGKIYIGATTQTLALRLGQHKENFKRWTKGKYHYVSSFEILQAGDAYIELLKECPCENKEQLARLEGEAIRNMPNCCNKVIPNRTTKEYYEANKETILQQKKEYHEANKQAILQQKKEYHEANKQSISQQRKQYYENNKQAISQQQKQYHEANKQAIRQQRKQHYVANKQAISQRRREYREANKDKINQRRRERRQQKKQQITNESHSLYNPHTTFFREPSNYFFFR